MTTPSSPWRPLSPSCPPETCNGANMAAGDHHPALLSPVIPPPPGGREGVKAAQPEQVPLIQALKPTPSSQIQPGRSDPSLQGTGINWIYSSAKQGLNNSLELWLLPLAAQRTFSTGAFWLRWLLENSSNGHCNSV